MSKRIKFTLAKLVSLKNPISKQPDKWYDSGCEGLAVFVMSQPSLIKVFYASWRGDVALRCFVVMCSNETNSSILVTQI